MSIGTIRIFNDIMGSGVIEPDESSGKITFSYRDIKITGYKILNEGQRVNYEILKTPKGLSAINVTPQDNHDKT